jgi:uncharacterized protein (DUF1330 family)
MPAYVIVHVESVNDPQRIGEYRRIGGPTLQAFGAEIIAINRPFEVLEGPAPQAIVVLRFPTMEAARTWYYSPEYQRALEHRLAGAHSRAVIVDGAA